MLGAKYICADLSCTLLRNDLIDRVDLIDKALGIYLCLVWWRAAAVAVRSC